MRALPLIASAALFLAARAEADFGPERLIGLAGGTQYQADIASDGKSFLIAWLNQASPERPSIEVVRVGADGTRMGSPVVLATPRGPTSAPSVAACGKGWVVAWPERERIEVHVLDGAGAPLQRLEERTDPRMVGGRGLRLGLACDGRGALIAWSHDERPELHALALPHGETRLRRLRLAVEGRGRFHAVAVTSDGDGFLVAWHSEVVLSKVDQGRRTTSVLRHRIDALRVSLEGAAPGQRPIEMFTGAETTEHAWERSIGGLSAAAAGRDDFLVTWDSYDREKPIHAVRLRGSRLVDASPLTLGGPGVWGVAVVAEPAGYLVAWTHWTNRSVPPAGDMAHQLRYARVPIEGARIVESALHVSASTIMGDVRLAHGAGRAIAVYAEGRTGEPGYTAGVDVWIKGAGGLPEAAPISLGPASQWAPALAARGPDYLVAWVDASTLPESIRTAAISPAGALVPSKGSVLARSAVPREISVSAGRSAYLVAWVEERGTFASRVSAEGEPLDPAPLHLGDGWQNVAASFDGEAHVLAFVTGKELRTIRIFEGGRAPEPAVRVGELSYSPSRVGMACERGSCLVTWQDSTGSHRSAPVHSLRIIHGRPEYRGTRPRQTILPEGYAGWPAVAAGGGRYLFAWGAYSLDSPFPYRILWTNVDQLAGVHGSRTGELPGHRRSHPSLAFDGRRFMAAWIEEGDSDPLRWGPVERGWLELPRSLGVKGISPALAATPGGGLTAAWLETPEKAPYRVRLRTLAPHASPPPPPAPATPQAATFRLPDLMALVRRSAATRAGERVEPEIDRQLRTLVARIQATTRRGLLPVDPPALPGRRQPGSGQVKYRSPWGSETASSGSHVTNAHYTGPGLALGGVLGGVVVVDGTVRIGSVTDSIVLATGDVRIDRADRSIVVAGGRIEIGEDGALLSSGHGFASILVSGRSIDAGSCGGVLAAADGVVVGNGGVATVNVPAGPIDGGAPDSSGAAAYQDPGLVLSDAAR